MDRPKETDGGPAVCFNPWLEARFVDGVKSNCMSCHQLAIWQPGAFLPVIRGSLPANHPLFQGRMKLDFLWSIAFESR